MAGHFFKSGVEAYRGHDLTAMRSRAGPPAKRTALAVLASVSGSPTSALPVPVISDRGHVGAKFRSFFEDYYNRVYFFPSSVGFGAISSTASRDIIVWNSHLTAVTLSATGLINGAGLSLRGPKPPHTFKALEKIKYTLTTSVDGPAILDAKVTFTFTPPETFLLAVSGSRAKVAPVWPNWRKSYQIEYQFKTDIFTSRTGKEQRRALRSTPRKKFNFEATPTFGKLRNFEGLMASWQNNTVVIPDLPRVAELASASKAGDTVIHLAGTSPDWVVKTAMLIFAHGGQYETRQIESVAGNAVTLTGSSKIDWAAGTKIHPGISGRLAMTIRSTRETDEVGVVQVEIDATPASEPVIEPPAAKTIFNGREVFTIKPNWSEKPDVSYESHREEIDYGRGRTEVFTPVRFSTIVRRHTYTSRSYRDMNLIREHFARMHGQRGEFYMPTWGNDIIPGLLSPKGTNSIRVRGTDFASQYAGSTVHKAVMVVFADGSTQYNVVASIYTVDDTFGADSVIQVTDVWSKDISPDNVKRVSWLLVWRHATDTLTIEWLTNSVGRCQLTVRSLEDLK